MKPTMTKAIDLKPGDRVRMFNYLTGKLAVAQVVSIGLAYYDRSNDRRHDHTKVNVVFAGAGCSEHDDRFWPRDFMFSRLAR